MMILIYFSNRFVHLLSVSSNLEIFELDLQVPLMVGVFLSQENSMTVVAGLAKNLDGDLNVKVDLALTALLKIHGDKYSITIWQPQMNC